MSLPRLKKHLKQQLTRQLSPRKPLKIRIKNSYRLILPAALLLVAGLLLFPHLQNHQGSELQRLMAQGIKQESLGRVEEALLSYSRVLEKYPDSEEAAEALYKTARLWHFDRQDPERALVYYLLLERDYSGSSQIRNAREAAAQIVKYDLRDDVQAIGYYQRLIDSQTGTPDQYLYEIADSYFRLENYPQARIELENLLEEYPQSSLVADVLQRKATILILENRTADARNDWLRLIEQFPESPYRSQARFNLAKLLEESGEFEEALEQYRQLEDFPRPFLLERKIGHLQQRIATRNEAN